VTAAAPAAAPAPAPAVRGRTGIVVEVPVRASREAAFAAMTQWSEQGRWMLGSKTWVSQGDGTGVGDELSCWTGAGRLGFLDTMTITSRDRECVVVEHTGRVVRGAGWMAVPEDDGPVRFVWGEALDIPLGVLGALGWRVLAPLVRLGVRVSLRRLAALVEAGKLPS
jgi:hypothetical protein